MYHNLFDSHTHSENSPDGLHSMTYITETAIARGLLGLAVTDHVEGERLESESYERRIRQSALDTAISREAFGKQLILTFGVEIGQVFEAREKMESILDALPFDFVLGSLHALAQDGFDFYEVDYLTFPPDKLHEKILAYYGELVDLIKWGRFDVLGHLSYPARYPKLLAGIDLDMKRYAEPIDEVLRLAAQAGKGIEINTSGLRNALMDTLPPEWIVRRFRELGGEIVTIGSDAHRVEDIGAGIEHAMAMLSRAGFEYFAFYRAREPVMLRII